MLAALNHPRIGAIYGLEDADGVPALVLELVDGETLAARIRRGPVAMAEALRIAAQIADALDFAHAKGIIHRDLKPANIKITTEGVVKVLDFGLAKVAAGPDADLSETPTTFVDHTAEGVILGTAPYMSPEQVRGHAVDRRTDIWAFGCVLYEMLTGRLAFPGATISDTIAAILQREPDWTALPAALSPSVARLLRRSLEKDAKHRLRDIGDARIELDDVLATSAAASIQRRPDVGPVRAWTPLPRWTTVFVIVTSAAAIGTFIATGASWQDGDTVPVTERPSDAPVVNTHELGRQAGALLERHDRDGNVDRAISLLDAAIGQDQRYAPGYAQLAEAYRQKYRDSPDRQWLQLAADSARRALGLNGDLAMAHAAQAFVALDDGKADEAIEGFRRAAALDPANGRAQMGIAMWHAARRDDASAEQTFQTAARMNPSDWRILADWGLFLYRRARYADAVAVWEKAREVTPDNVVIFKNLGAAYHQLGRYDDAAASLQQALEIQPSAATYTNVGTTRFYQGQYHEAVAAFEKAVELAANSALYWGNLGDAYRWAPGRRADSIPAYLRATDIVRSELAARPADLDLRSRLAAYLAKAGKRREALDEIARVEKVTPLQPQVLIRLAQAYEVTGQRAPALNLIERAVQAGFPRREVANEPEFLALRADIRYQRQLANSGR
jgi:serine/threonine-protein kinase